MLLLRDKLKLVALSVGVFLCHIFMGIVYEIIFKTNYDGEKFNFPVSLVAVKNITYAIIAKFLAVATSHSKNETPQKYYILAAFFYFLGMTTANMSIIYMSYHVVIIIKACKPIPVMISSVLIARKTYTIQKYFFVLAIVAGVVIFMYDDFNSSESDFESLYGNILLGTSLLMDGFTSAAQELMRKKSKPSTLNFMIFNSTWSSLISIVVLLSTGEERNFIFFCLKFPIVLIYIAIVLLTGFLGQFCISSLILNFGSLPCSIVTTLRKFSTVLLSIFIFNNNLTLQQWLATILIFFALSCDILFGRKKSMENSEAIESNKINIIVIDAENSMEEKGNEKTLAQ